MAKQLPMRRRCPRLSSGQLCLQVHIVILFELCMESTCCNTLVDWIKFDGFGAWFWLDPVNYCKLLEVLICLGRDRCTHSHRATGDEEGKESCGGQCCATKLELRPWCRICLRDFSTFHVDHVLMFQDLHARATICEGFSVRRFRYQLVRGLSSLTVSTQRSVLHGL